MRRLHDLHAQVEADFDPLGKLRQYRSHITQPLYDLTPYEAVIEAIKELHNPKILCHNDWGDGNMLFRSV